MKNIKEKWDFTLFYKSDKDPKIGKDLKAIEKAYSDFERMFKGKDFISSAPKLLKALEAYRRVLEVANNFKPLWYFTRRKDVESSNDYVTSKLTICEERINKATNKAVFFKIELAKITSTKQKEFLKDRRLSHFSYFLKVVFDKAKYNLTEKEEQLSSLLSQPGLSMWTDGQEKLLNSQTVRFKGKDLPIAGIPNLLANLEKKDRHALHQDTNKVLQSISHFAEAEINAIYNFKKIMDERRKFSKPYSQTVINYEDEEKAVENLVSLVTRNFKISHRFYKLHAKLLKEKKLMYADRSVRIGQVNKKFNFEETLKLVKKAFTQVHPKYAEILERFAKAGQFDIYPKKGKKGGAYCADGADKLTFILLNHTDDVRSLETLAHEMGHAFHTEMSRTQPVHYRDYATPVAEVASTFFEQVALSELEKELSISDRIILRHNLLLNDIATIFRQIACFNFELELHERIRKEGMLSSLYIAKLLKKHLQSYLGSAVDVSDEDGYGFVSWPHLRYFFYVYSYAYGQLISRALFEKWQEDKSYINEIEKFLKAGGSMSPKDIFKSIGIDTTSPKFFESGLKAIERDIEKLEKLTKTK